MWWIYNTIILKTSYFTVFMRVVGVGVGSVEVGIEEDPYES
jgi:hypothetical protein